MEGSFAGQLLSLRHVLTFIDAQMYMINGGWDVIVIFLIVSLAYDTHRCVTAKNRYSLSCP